MQSRRNPVKTLSASLVDPMTGNYALRVSKGRQLQSSWFWKGARQAPFRASSPQQKPVASQMACLKDSSWINTRQYSKVLVFRSAKTNKLWRKRKQTIGPGFHWFPPYPKHNYPTPSSKLSDCRKNRVVIGLKRLPFNDKQDSHTLTMPSWLELKEAMWAKFTRI